MPCAGMIISLSIKFLLVIPVGDRYNGCTGLPVVVGGGSVSSCLVGWDMGLFSCHTEAADGGFLGETGGHVGKSLLQGGGVQAGGVHGLIGHAPVGAADGVHASASMCRLMESWMLSISAATRDNGLHRITICLYRKRAPQAVLQKRFNVFILV